MTAFNTTKKTPFLANTIEIIGRYLIMMSSPFEKEPPQKKTNCLLTFDEERGSFTFIEIETEQLFELFLNDLPLFHKSELTFVGMHIPDH